MSTEQIPGSADAGSQESEARYRSLVEASSDAIALCDVTGTIITVNARAAEMIGYGSADQMVGRNVFELVAPVDRERALGAVRRRVSLQELRGIDTEYDLQRVDGSTFPAEVSSAIILDAAGRPAQLTVVARDITARKQVEREHAALLERERAARMRLELVEATLRSVIDASPLAIVTMDREAYVTGWNAAAERTFGWTAQEVVGRLSPTIPDDEDPGQTVQLAEVLDGESVMGIEVRRKRKDGTLIDVRVSSAPLHDADGQITGAVVLVEDITERLRREAELARLYRETAKAAAERELILGQIADGVIIADAEGRIIFTNAAVGRIYGIRVVDVAVDGYSSAYHVLTMDGTPAPARELPLARAVLYGETVLNHQIRVARPDGTLAVVVVSAAPVRDEEGNRVGAVLTARDMTEQYDIAVQKDQFLSTAAHDLKTPLTTIKGMSQLLERITLRAEQPDVERIVEGLRRIDATASRMTGLINEMLDMARIQMGRPLDLVRKPVDLITVVEDAVDEVRASSSQEVVIRTTLHELLGQWDAFRIERVLDNLLSNAVKYSPNGGDIVIELWTEDDWAVLRVSDQGIGIPEEDLPHIFDRFHRGANVSGQIPGTGLGLAGVRQIVEQHGGTVGAENGEQGAVFTVRLPITPPRDDTMR